MTKPNQKSLGRVLVDVIRRSWPPRGHSSLEKGMSGEGKVANREMSNLPEELSMTMNIYIYIVLALHDSDK